MAFRSTALAETTLLAGFVLAVLALAVSPPKVAPAAPPSRAEPPPSRLVDRQTWTLSTYLSLKRTVAGLASVAEVTRAQALQAGMAEPFPGVSRLRVLEAKGRNLGVEELLALRPDAILTTPGDAAELRRIGFPGVTPIAAEPNFIAPLKEWRADARLIGQPQGGERMIETFQARRDAVLKAVAGKPPTRQAVLFGGAGFLSLAGRDYYLNTLLAEAGGTRQDPSALYFPQVNVEQLLLRDPDVILLNAQPGDDNLPDFLYRDPAYGLLRAVRQRRVYKMPVFGTFLGAPQRGAMLRWSAEVLHPDLPRTFRDDYRQAYLDAYGYRLTDARINQDIFMAGNSRSAGYERFAVPSR